MRARAIAEARDRGTARARMRSRDGPLAGLPRVQPARLDGTVGDTALVIEPAKASEVAPIIVQAYELSPREQEITQLIAQGLGTADLATGCPLHAHRARLREGDLREGQGLQPRRAGGEAVRRALRAGPSRPGPARPDRHVAPLRASAGRPRTHAWRASRTSAPGRRAGRRGRRPGPSRCPASPRSDRPRPPS